MIKYKNADFMEFLDANDYVSLGDKNAKLENTIIADSSLDAQLGSILEKICSSEIVHQIGKYNTLYETTRKT